ncbi:MAG: hypothetical protein ACI9YR_001675, partial [Bacteroidia bacterium]
ALPIAAVVMVFVRHLLARYKQSEYYDRGDDSGDENSPSKPDSSL